MQPTALMDPAEAAAQQTRQAWERNHNPYAAPALSGINYQPPPGAVDFFGGLIQNVTLQANQVLANQTVAIDAGYAFVLLGISVIEATSFPFNLRIVDPAGAYLSDQYMQSDLVGVKSISPMPVFPALEYPPQGRIGADFQNLSGAPNTIRVCYYGIKRYRG